MQYLLKFIIKFWWIECYLTSKARLRAVATCLSLSTWLSLSPRTWTFEALSCHIRVQLAMPSARETMRGEHIETEQAAQEVVGYGSHIAVWYNNLFFQNRCYLRWDRIDKGYWIHWLTIYFWQLDLRYISGKLEVWSKNKTKQKKPENLKYRAVYLFYSKKLK